jgi:thioredoxin-dependent peroxiredoxin
MKALIFYKSNQKNLQLYTFFAKPTKKICARQMQWHQMCYLEFKIESLTTFISMSKVSFKGAPVNLKGDLPKEGQKAEDFVFVKSDMTEARFSDIKDKIKVLIAVSSLDTSVCAAEAFNFSHKLSSRPQVEALVISKDLPFAMKRYMQNNHITNLTPASDYRYCEFVKKYNTEMLDGPLQGLSARAVIIVDKDDVIKYVELVPEVSTEPQYNKALAIIDSLL